MGANVSSSMADDDGPQRPRLGDIPENCVALILTFMDPPDVCKFARLNRAFRAASSADFIWESKLPSNYRFIIEKVLENSDMVEKLGKREIYARLCSPNSFDGGSKEIWLDKSTGGVFLSISSRALRITGIDDRRYWNFISTEESRFQTVAYLQQTWWLEVEGEIEFQFPAGNYSIFIRLHLGRPFKRLGRRVCNLEHVHGWGIKPVKFQLTTSDGQHDVSKCCLDNPGNWVNYHVGNFVVEDPNSLMKIKFSVTQIDCTHTKGGVCVDSVLICPSSVGKEARSLS
ncbi:F-box protein PP2-A13 [Morus notabilis]|uniref:F-box protein PP2-A13 n=1 Tax=Morus notabilis TaxID=981085 RepID=W9QNT7_9ROSA|nr:F-box protein PP2-A13 [Morus notabilis]EXB44730.1 F-box protein PP2-A13 [Morus notabilis]